MSGDWLVRIGKPAERPVLRLLCLPHAGGGPSLFRSWANALPPGVELVAAQLPGRDRRLAETPCRDSDTIIKGIVRAALALPSVPLALYGHSLGAALALDLAVSLTQAKVPLALVTVAARAAPHLPPRRAPLSPLADHAFLQAVGAMGGTPREALEHEELMALLLPVLRADFFLSEGFVRPPAPAIKCPLLAVTGCNDPFVAEADMRAWSLFAANRFRFETLEAGHFFAQSHRDDILRLIFEETGCTSFPVRSALCQEAS
ncbi:thioesterase II family protein [Magnetospirillum molischianum]|uniref:Putative Linear gramicidin dehydrogenase lgrE n=1 Tax=Magnetospirillum molischianum DSM 120 TaxID=1150626 RepID=H8FV49_MAGML|nr:alpha/beta fold hydrolase [Magnetospirillum molischianum]CCG42237.1 putative Linear gramicidin dehydrogenase lgrE [Magnetospirillum molischianum DSM 120]